MKQRFKIEDFEDKKTKADKRYTRFKTSDGWMSCFNQKACEYLKTQCGNEVDLEIVESGDFKNIRGYYAEGETENKSAPVSKIQDVAPKSSKGTSYYTAYAKDIFIAIFNENKDLDQRRPTSEYMNAAIELVKQAKEAFS